MTDIWANRADAIDTMARTIWGEARGCGYSGMQHVASVIVNRASNPSWWGTDIETVCHKPYQFSCRNPGDPNRVQLLTVTPADREFALALRIAQMGADTGLPDDTGGADSYFAIGTPAPAWAATAVKTFSDGWHSFYRTVAAKVMTMPRAAAE